VQENRCLLREGASATFEAMSELEAVEALHEAELVTVAQGRLGEIKELQDKCLDAGIPAMAARPDQGCNKCGASLHLMVRETDVTRVVELMQRAWSELVAREGVAATLPAPGQVAVAGDDLPCPACGTVAPLVKGACSDCGLQLE
jgi:hypothetical protein